MENIEISKELLALIIVSCLFIGILFGVVVNRSRKWNLIIGKRKFKIWIGEDKLENFFDMVWSTMWNLFWIVFWGALLWKIIMWIIK